MRSKSSFSCATSGVSFSAKATRACSAAPADGSKQIPAHFPLNIAWGGVHEESEVGMCSGYARKRPVHLSLSQLPLYLPPPPPLSLLPSHILAIQVQAR